jgi:hypothetical protein
MVAILIVRWTQMKFVGKSVVKREAVESNGRKMTAKIDVPPKVNLLGVVIGKILMAAMIW